VMRVTVTLTISERETVLEGDAGVFDTCWTPKDELEDRHVGFWLSNWRYVSEYDKGSYHKSLVFCPWTVLMVETSDGKEEQEG